VGSWIAAVIIVILVVGVGCYLAGWEGHRTHRWQYEAQRRASPALVPARPAEFPAQSPLSQPVVVTVYLAPGNSEQGVVVHTHIPSPLPASSPVWAATVVDPAGELP
jgi:hypothetical protein